MALIKCPECGKEISDKASTCPNCGCPIKNEEISDFSIPEKTNIGSGINRVSGVNNNNKALILIFGVLILIAIIVLIIIKIIPQNNKNEEVTTEASTEDTSKEVYDEAIDLIESGDYEAAKEKFETISDYKDVSIILEQIPWETRAFVCIEKLKDRLKSPDSLKVYEVAFFSNEQRNDAKADQETIDKLKDIFGTEEEAPVVVIHYGGENTMGGTTEAIILFIYDKGTHQYVAYGSTKTLDKDKAKDDEEDVVFLYDTMNENFERIGNVDVDRINKIIKNGVYTNVKIIEN